MQATELLRLCEERIDLMLRHLVDVDSDLPSDGEVRLSRDTLAELSSLAESTWQFAERIAQLTAYVPDDGVDASYSQVAEAAAQELSQGILDVERARWVAVLLDREAGWHALGAGLRSVDIRSAWGSVKVADLVGAFRGVGSTRTRDTLNSAQIPGDAEFESCSADAMHRLADVLCGEASSAE